MFQPRQHNLLTRLFYLSCQEDLIQYRVDLILTHPLATAIIALIPQPTN